MLHACMDGLIINCFVCVGHCGIRVNTNSVGLVHKEEGALVCIYFQPSHACDCGSLELTPPE